VYIYGSYRKIKTGYHFWTTMYIGLRAKLSQVGYHA